MVVQINSSFYLKHTTIVSYCTCDPGSPCTPVVKILASCHINEPIYLSCSQQHHVPRAHFTVALVSFPDPQYTRKEGLVYIVQTFWTLWNFGSRDLIGQYVSRATPTCNWGSGDETPVTLEGIAAACRIKWLWQIEFN